MQSTAKQDMKRLMAANGMTEEQAGEMVILLEDCGYFKVPASLKYHGAWMGGLFEHSWETTAELLRLTTKLGLRWQEKRSPVLVGMLHDLCKTEDYSITVFGSVKRMETKGHGERSVSLAEQLLQKIGAEPLTEEEKMCIRWHMGAFDDKDNWSCYGNAVERYETVLWTHTADMYASRVQGV